MFKEDVPILTCVFFTLNWLTLTPGTHFVQFYLKVASYFLLWGKNKFDTEDEAFLIRHKKIKIDISEIGTFSAITSKV